MAQILNSINTFKNIIKLLILFSIDCLKSLLIITCKKPLKKSSTVICQVKYIYLIINLIIHNPG